MLFFQPIDTNFWPHRSLQNIFNTGIITKITFLKINSKVENYFVVNFYHYSCVYLLFADMYANVLDYVSVEVRNAFHWPIKFRTKTKPTIMIYMHNNI